MKELIHIHNQGPELRADSREIAKLFGIEHESLRLIIDRYTNEIEQFGHLRFEIGDGKKRPQGGGKQEKFAYLNFDQIALLLILTRTTGQTLPLRLQLLQAFKDARAKLRPIDNALLTIPDAWRKTFPDDLYSALLPLYGDTFDPKINKPGWVGMWTNRFIYRPLYDSLPAELKARRKFHAASMGTEEWRALHQFIEKNAKENLKKHIIKVTTLLQASSAKSHFAELFFSVFRGETQLLFGLEDIEDEFK